MGKISHASPGQFANELGDYLRYLVDANGRTGGAGRWLAKVTDGARKHEYWLAIIKGEREMTSNDVDVISKTFGLADPFAYVRNAHTLAETGAAPTFNVGPHEEDYEISEDPGEYGLAAQERPTPGK
jgi:hypothetical protein